MPRPPRRAPAAPRLESLEPRTLLSAGELLVRLAGPAPTPAAARALGRLGAEVVRSYPDGPSVVRLPDGIDPAAAARQLSRVPGVAYAEADRTVRTQGVIPNDARLGEQWGVEQANNVDVDLPEAWGLTPGSPAVVVAVVDTGMDVTHPDLAGRLWANPGEVPGNGRDDDRNGYVDDVHGWDFTLNTGVMRDTDGHGTHVSGIIAAQANNGAGVAGVAPGVRLMPLRFIGAGGDGAVSDAVDAIYYAVAQGARVINASWGGGGYSQALADAIRYAGSRNVVFVTAAGNERANNDSVRSYPSAYRFGTTLSVAAVDASGRLASFSNYGARTVDVAAPGVDVLSTVPGGGYDLMDGTSMAAPFVSGVVALVASINPAATATQIVQWVTGTAKPLPGLAGRVVGGGIVSAGRAVGAIPLSNPAAQAVNPPTTRPSAPTPASPTVATLRDDDVRAMILGTDEYYRRVGGTPARFVAAMHLAVTGRPIDAATRSRLLSQLQRGQGRQQVARGLLAQSAAQGMKVAQWLVDDLRLNVPPATLAAGRDVAALAALLVSGTPDNDVHAALLDASPYKAAQGGTPQGFVTGLYRDALGRGIAPAELAYWTGQLAQGRSTYEVARVILAAPEAQQTKVARWAIRDLGWSGTFAQLKANPAIVSLAAQLRG
jgi:subtilisin family serine protease